MSRQFDFLFTAEQDGADEAFFKFDFLVEGFRLFRGDFAMADGLRTLDVKRPEYEMLHLFGEVLRFAFAGFGFGEFRPDLGRFEYRARQRGSDRDRAHAQRHGDAQSRPVSHLVVLLTRPFS